MLSSHEVKEINRFCAEHGSDLDLVQGQGGNFSVKGEDWMLIKGSGLRLEEALDKNIFVLCNLSAIRTAYIKGDEAAIKDTVIDASGLRPSIETSLHSVLPEKFVFHFHSINAIALSAQEARASLLQETSQRLNAPIVQYAKPGIALANAVEANGADHHSFLLRNHGALVQAPTLETLKDRVDALRETALTMKHSSNLNRVFTPVSCGWIRNSDDDAVFLGKMAISNETFRHSNLYPDHPVILGSGIATSRDDKRFWYVDDTGLFIRDEDAARSALPMIECLIRVTQKLDFSESFFEGLKVDEVEELLNWESEQYRQRLTSRG